MTEDLEAVTERLKSAEEAHSREVEEHQRRSNDLQERLVETRNLKEQVSAATTGESGRQRWFRVLSVVAMMPSFVECLSPTFSPYRRPWLRTSGMVK